MMVLSSYAEQQCSQGAYLLAKSCTKTIKISVAVVSHGDVHIGSYLVIPCWIKADASTYVASLPFQMMLVRRLLISVMIMVIVHM